MNILNIEGNRPYLNEQELVQLKNFMISNEDTEIHILNDNIALREFLVNNGIEAKRIVMIFSTHHPLMEYLGYTNYNTDARFVCPIMMTSKMSTRQNWVLPYTINLNYSGSTFQFNYDYVRYGTISLISEEINKNNVEGDIAELGVYRGEFSSVLNASFPERNLHMFDTFEGFNDADIEIERGGGIRMRRLDILEIPA